MRRHRKVPLRGYQLTPRIQTASARVVVVGDTLLRGTEGPICRSDLIDIDRGKGN